MAFSIARTHQRATRMRCDSSYFTAHASWSSLLTRHFFALGAHSSFVAVDLLAFSSHSSRFTRDFYCRISTTRNRTARLPAFGRTISARGGTITLGHRDKRALEPFFFAASMNKAEGHSDCSSARHRFVLRD
jgi:hypothetical protein